MRGDEPYVPERGGHKRWDRQSHEANAGFQSVEGAGNVLQRVGAEHACSREELDELPARRVKAEDACKASNILIVVFRQKVHELARRAVEPCPPAPHSPHRHGSGKRPARPGGDRARYGCPPAPEVTSDEGRQHTPRRPAVGPRADVANDGDPDDAGLIREDALGTIMDVQAVAATASADRRAIAVGVPKTALVFVELVNVGGDQRSATEACAARLNEADLRCGRSSSRHDLGTTDREPWDRQLFGRGSCKDPGPAGRRPRSSVRRPRTGRCDAPISALPRRYSTSFPVRMYSSRSLSAATCRTTCWNSPAVSPAFDTQP